MRLSDPDFLKIIDYTPLVSIDLVIKNTGEKILLGQRMNKPAQGYWFVPGGRILKNETIKEAYTRILFSETGLKIPFSKAQLLGVYDHIYDDNFLGAENVNTHYVVMGFSLSLDENISIVTDDQHSRTLWWEMEDLKTSEQVHINTKRYFPN